jgi:hypothetical protein
MHGRALSHGDARAADLSAPHSFDTTTLEFDASPIHTSSFFISVPVSAARRA